MKTFTASIPEDVERIFKKYLESKACDEELIRLHKHGLVAPDFQSNSKKYVLTFIGVQLQQQLNSSSVA